MRMRVRLYDHQLFMLPDTYSREEAEDLIRSLPVVDTGINADVVDWKDVKGHMFAIVVFDDGSVSTRRLTEIREETRDSRERKKKESIQVEPVKKIVIHDTKPDIEEVVGDMIEQGLLCDDDDWP